MDVVSEYQPGRSAIPEIMIEINRKKPEAGLTVHKPVTVHLTGVDQPYSFNLRCTHESRDRG